MIETYNGLPLFYGDIDDTVEGISLISLVDNPAVQTNFLKLSKEEKIQFSFDEDKHIVTGVALIPEQKIYRRNSNGEEWYITFTAAAIQRIVEKFFNTFDAKCIDLEHSENKIDTCVIFESYILNKERGICPVEFSSMPDGTWFLSVKVNDENLWQDIKEGKYNGFSIDALLRMETKEVKVAEKEISTLEELFDWLEGLG